MGMPHYLPPYFSTQQRNRYPITVPNLLLGTTQAPSHFPVASSTIPYTGNPILYNLSCPSHDQRSWMPMGIFFVRTILFDPGALFSKPWGAWVFIVSTIKARGKCSPLRDARRWRMVRGPAWPDGSRSSWLRTSCVASVWDFVLRLEAPPSRLLCFWAQNTELSLQRGLGPSASLYRTRTKWVLPQYNAMLFLQTLRYLLIWGHKFLVIGLK